MEHTGTHACGPKVTVPTAPACASGNGAVLAPAAAASAVTVPTAPAAALPPTPPAYGASGAGLGRHSASLSECAVPMAPNSAAVCATTPTYTTHAVQADAESALNGSARPAQIQQTVLTQQVAADGARTGEAAAEPAKHLGATQPARVQQAVPTQHVAADGVRAGEAAAEPPAHPGATAEPAQQVSGARHGARTCCGSYSSSS